MRPRQWSKNIFVFAALVFDSKLFDVPSLLRTLAAFILLCFMSSAVYLMNDLADIESDRQHPIKRRRPLPAGQLSPVVAQVAAVVLAVGSLGAAALLSHDLALVLLIYLVLQIAYTFRLKHVAHGDLAHGCGCFGHGGDHGAAVFPLVVRLHGAAGAVYGVGQAAA